MLVCVCVCVHVCVCCVCVCCVGGHLQCVVFSGHLVDMWQPFSCRLDPSKEPSSKKSVVTLSNGSALTGASPVWGNSPCWKPL